MRAFIFFGVLLQGGCPERAVVQQADGAAPDAAALTDGDGEQKPCENDSDCEPGEMCCEDWGKFCVLTDGCYFR